MVDWLKQYFNQTINQSVSQSTNQSKNQSITPENISTWFGLTYSTGHFSKLHKIHYPSPIYFETSFTILTFWLGLGNSHFLEPQYSQNANYCTLLYISFLKLSSSSLDCSLFSRSTLERVSCSRAYLADSRASFSSWHSFLSSCITASKFLASWFTVASCPSLSESFLWAAFKASSVFLWAATSLSSLKCT